jgi:hypothetical protein
MIRTAAGQDLIAAILASWMTLGGFVDGYAHRSLDTPETFFTPWHGVLYSGFLAVAGWLTWLLVRNRPHTASLSAAIPAGYGTSFAGVLVFAAGGLGDMVWHTVFGIEVSIDALLSPTHLMLLVGALLILSGPLRSAWLHADPGPGSGRRFPALLALTMGAGQLGFFFQYMDGTSVRLMQTHYFPGPRRAISRWWPGSAPSSSPPSSSSAPCFSSYGDGHCRQGPGCSCSASSVY